jgi:hypothetical protein
VEVLYLVCGARRPQLKRHPLDGGRHGMRLFTYTPPKAWQLAAFALALYASAPVFAIAYYGEMLRKGAYPPEADSIGIPIYDDTRLAVFFAPVFYALVGLIIHRYPGSVPLLVWNRARPIWSWVCSVLFGAAIATVATGLGDVWRWKLPLEFLSVALWIWLLLFLRAAVVARPSQQSLNGRGDR